MVVVTGDEDEDEDGSDNKWEQGKKKRAKGICPG